MFFLERDFLCSAKFFGFLLFFWVLAVPASLEAVQLRRFVPMNVGWSYPLKITLKPPWLRARCGLNRSPAERTKTWASTAFSGHEHLRQRCLRTSEKRAALGPRARYSLRADRNGNEWSYKAGLDGEPSVSLTLRLLDLHNDRTVWHAAGSRSGWSRESVGTVAQTLVERLIGALRVA